MESQYSTRSPAVKRLMREAKELQQPTHMYHAQPLDDNLFEWHFTVRGAEDTDFADGIYHGRITLPSEYPMKPPSIILLTPNGRFQVNTKICLSISGYHPETWQPSWSIRTALLAIIGFMPTPGEGAIGALDYTKEERQQLAQKSLQWCCTSCQRKLCDVLLSKEDDEITRERDAQETKELVSQIRFKDENTTKAEVAAAADQLQTSQAEASIVRQRTTERARPLNETLPVFEHQTGNDNWCQTLLLNILIALLVIAIAALVIRRMSLQSIEQSDIISETLASSQDQSTHRDTRPIIPPPGGQV